jgi:formamidopyrimidine-DNA glycosylase
MPEMPEVETIARKLRRTIVGKSIKTVWLSGASLRRAVDASFSGCLVSRKIRRVLRRGKYLIIELEPRAYWLIHLGMSGRVVFSASRLAAPKHTHAIIRFSDSSELQYRDHRRFGLLAAYSVEKLAGVPELDALGKDPLSRGLTPAWLQDLVAGSRQEIKAFLLDQTKVAGLGNIYVCEALFHARIHPGRRCFTLTPPETGALVRAIRKTIRMAVRNRGTTFSDFMDSDGELGDNQHFLRVFQLEGKKCRRCRFPIERLRQGNRSSFFCPGCQH